VVGNLAVFLSMAAYGVRMRGLGLVPLTDLFFANRYRVAKDDVLRYLRGARRRAARGARGGGHGRAGGRR